MTYNRPSLAQLSTQIENDIYTRFGSTSRPARFSINKIISRVIAGAVHLIYGYIDFCMKQIMPDSATSEYLDRWALVWGIQRKLANKATGKVQFNGNNGALIPAFTQIQTSDNYVFQTLYDVLIQDGKVSVPIEALIPSKLGNMKGGISLNLLSPIANVGSNCFLDENGTKDGSDVESDDELRERILKRIRNAPCAGNKQDYEIWCLQVPGVTRAWCYPQYQGNGNVGLSFVRDNDETIIPNELQQQEVYNYITAIMPCTATLKIFPLAPKVIDFKIKSADISDVAQKQILDQLIHLFFNIANPGKTVYISDILQSLSFLKTIERISLIAPTQDIIFDDKSVGIVGAITLEKFDNEHT